MFKKNFIASCVSAVLMFTMFFSFSYLQIKVAYSAALTTPISDIQSSVKVSALSDHTIQFVTPSGVGVGQSIVITFPAQFTMGTFSVNNIDFATSTSASCSSFNQETLAATSSGSVYGVAQLGQTITITSDTAIIPANRCVQIKIGANATFGATGVTQITNPSSSNFYSLTVDGTFGDTGTITTHIIPDDTVALTGTVSQSLTFSISTSTLYFGILSSGAAKYASSTNTAGDTSETIAHTLSVSTNAPSGFALTVKGQTLTSQQNSNNTITEIGGTAASSTPGTEQFGIRATESGGVGTAITQQYAYGTSYAYDATATTTSIFATGSGSTPTSVYSLRYITNIGPITEAGTYAANLTYVATANF